jgi:NADH dehydrogenase
MGQQGRATVFGGTGFLGRRIVAHLQAHGFQVRIAVRGPERTGSPDDVEQVAADVRDGVSVGAAIAGSRVVVNAVALYVERGRDTFAGVHVQGAHHVADAATKAGVERLVHISGVGATRDSPSAYVRCRAAGEASVRDGFAGACILRPCVMFAPNDAFIAALLRLVRLAPVVPLFGDGGTRLQPVYAEDVAETVARLAMRPQPPASLYEVGGPKIYSYRSLLQLVMAQVERWRPLIPVPFAAWDLLALILSMLPRPPLTSGQVALMRQDNVAAPHLMPFEQLGFAPVPLEDILSMA